VFHKSLGWEIGLKRKKSRLGRGWLAGKKSLLLQDTSSIALEDLAKNQPDETNTRWGRAECCPSFAVLLPAIVGPTGHH
jgi:hypothetical protein